VGYSFFISRFTQKNDSNLLPTSQKSNQQARQATPSQYPRYAVLTLPNKISTTALTPTAHGETPLRGVTFPKI
jgi:hypothetical protein